MKKGLLITIIAVFFIGTGVIKASASDFLVSQTSTSTSCAYIGSGGDTCSISYQSQGVQYLGTGLNGTSTSVEVYYNTNLYSVSFKLISCDLKDLSTYPVSCTGYSEYDITTSSSLSGIGWKSIDFVYRFLPDKFYYLKPAYNNLNNGYSELVNLGDTPSGYSSDFYWKDFNTGSVYSGKTLAFKIFGDGFDYNSVNEYLSVNSISIPNYSQQYFNVNLNNQFATSTSGYLYFVWRYHSSTSTGFQGVGGYYNSTSTSSVFDVGVNDYQMTTTFPFGNYKYDIWAVWSNVDESYTAVSPMVTVDFTEPIVSVPLNYDSIGSFVNGLYSGTSNFTSSTLSNFSSVCVAPGLTVNISDYIGYAGCVLFYPVGKIIDFIVMPSDTANRYFASGLSYVKKQFPFNLVTGSYDAILNIVNQFGDATTTMVFSIPQHGDISLNLDMATIANSEIKSQYFGWVEFFIWLGAGVTIMYIIL